MRPGAVLSSGPARGAGAWPARVLFLAALAAAPPVAARPAVRTTPAQAPQPGAGEPAPKSGPAEQAPAPAAPDESGFAITGPFLAASIGGGELGDAPPGLTGG